MRWQSPVFPRHLFVIPVKRFHPLRNANRDAEFPVPEDAPKLSCRAGCRATSTTMLPHAAGKPRPSPRGAFHRLCSYFLTPETATHFGGVPASICPEGQGSVGFGAAEGGAPGTLGADGMA